MPLEAAFVKAIDDGAAARRKVDTRTIVVDVPAAQAFAPVRRIGGAAGWYFGNLLWRARAVMDRCLGGAVMQRGRRDPDACAVGDAIDGWTVEAYEPDRRLRLSADMKLPGRGWLEFEVTPIDDGRRSIIRQTATFDPRGVLGRVYWYAILPIHGLMFRGMLERIAARAGKAGADPDITVFERRSTLPARPADVFRWHERPEALLDLMPSHRGIRIEQQTGGLHDGGRVTLSFGVGRFRMRWEARHYGYVRDRQFCDEQVRGPFKIWRHTHRVEPAGDARTLYEDRVEFAVPGGPLVRRLLQPFVRRLLERAFASRHQIVYAAMAQAGRRHDAV